MKIFYVILSTYLTFFAQPSSFASEQEDLQDIKKRGNFDNLSSDNTTSSKYIESLPEPCLEALNTLTNDFLDEKLSSLEKAANNGDNDAKFNLALSYYDGEGVVIDTKKDKKLFEEAANNGDYL